MKNTKKLPTKQLEKFSNIFMQLGLVLVLFIVYVILEHQTVQETVMSHNFPQEPKTVYVDPDTEILFTKEPKVVPKVKIAKSAPFIVDEVVKGDNNIIETIIEDPTIEDPQLIDIDAVIEVKIDEAIVEDVPFDFIQDAPVFKGCENLSKEDNKVCFDKKMKRFIHRNFDVDLANELGLHSGKHRIHSQFIINKEGKVIDVKIIAPHKRLEKETQRIIKKLPKFKPGKQNNTTVKVRYSLPITFSVN